MKEIDFLSYLLVPPSITLILTLIRKEDMDTRSVLVCPPTSVDTVSMYQYINT